MSAVSVTWRITGFYHLLAYSQSNIRDNKEDKEKKKTGRCNVKNKNKSPLSDGYKDYSLYLTYFTVFHNFTLAVWSSS